MKKLSYSQVPVVSSLPTATTALAGTVVRLSSDNKPYWCNGSSWVDLTATGSGSYPTTAHKVVVTKTAHGLTVGKWTDLDGLAPYVFSFLRPGLVGMVSAVVDANNIEVTLEGRISGLSGLTNAELYVPDTARLGNSIALSANAIAPATLAAHRYTEALPTPKLVATSTTAGIIVQPLDASSYLTNRTIIQYVAGQTSSAMDTYIGKLVTVTGSLAEVNDPTLPPYGVAVGYYRNVYTSTTNGFDCWDMLVALPYDSEASTILPNYSQPVISLTAADNTPVYAASGGAVSLTPSSYVVGVVLNNEVYFREIAYLPPFGASLPITVSTTPPASPSVGDVWIDIS